MLPRVEYIEWIEGRPREATHDLGSSDLRTARTPADRVVPPALEGLADPGPEVSLAEQVAAAHGVDREKVALTAGATHAYYLAVAAALDGDGDAVLVEKPGYEPLRRTPEALGGNLDRYRRPHDEGSPLSPDRIRAAVRESTVLAVATNRHNPTGRLAEEGTLAAAAEAAAAGGARLRVDEVYAPNPAAPRDGAFGGPTAAGLDGAVVTGSLTKFHGLGGLRIGWVIADEPFVQRVRRGYGYLPVRAEPSTALARRALASHEQLAARSREQLRENHDQLTRFVANRPDLTAAVYDGCPFGLLAHEDADGDAVAEAAWERGLLVVPGRFFELPEGFRVSLGGAPETMAEALSVLGETLDAL